MSGPTSARRDHGNDDRSRLVAGRLSAQRIGGADFTEPAAVVRHLLAVQAQELPAALFAVGVRLTGEPREADIRGALSAGSVLRTHALRGTWQLVTPVDARWLLSLIGPVELAAATRRYNELGLDEATRTNGVRALARAVEAGTHRTRAEMQAALADAGIGTDGPRLSHLLHFAELSSIIVSGAMRGNAQTYAAFDQRVPPSAPLDREEALARLAGRYFQSRGPATLADFVWWSGLSIADARRAIAAAGAALVETGFGGVAHWAAADLAGSPAVRGWALLPAFDEYLIAYKNRSAMLDPSLAKAVNAGGGLLAPVVLLDGRVVATWRREFGRREVTITVAPFRPMPPAGGLDAAATRYGAFLGLAAKLSIKDGTA